MSRSTRSGVRAEQPARFLEFGMDRRRDGDELLIRGRKLDRDERDQHDPQRSEQQQRRPRVRQEQPDAQHDARNRDRRARQEAQPVPAANGAPGDQITDDERERGRDRRRAQREHHRVPQATGVASSSKKTKWTCESVRFANVGTAGAIFTNAASSSAPYGSTIALSRTNAQNASAAHFHAPEPRDRAPRALAADERVAFAAQHELLRAQQRQREQQHRHRRRRGQRRLGRKLEQAPDPRRHRVKSGRQREHGGRAEHRHRLQERDQRAGQDRGQDQRQRDAPSRLRGVRAQVRRRVFEIGRIRSSAFATNTNAYGNV